MRFSSLRLRSWRAIYKQNNIQDEILNKNRISSFFAFKKLSQIHPQQEEDIHKNYPHQKQEKNDAF